MDFDQSIYENRRKRKDPFVAAHRGVSRANIPCNTMAAFRIAVDQGADVVEIDITKSKDGQYFVFHPGMEPVFLDCGKYIPEMTAKEVREIPLKNQDGVPTGFRVPSLVEVFSFLKDKVYINVDKFWMDVEGITEQIRKAGVEKQVIVKSGADEESFAQVEKYAPDLMYCVMMWHKDSFSEELLKRRLNYIGAEILFDRESDEIVSDAYIRWMHEHKLLIWANSIVYNEKEVIAAGHSDDSSLTQSPDLGGGWLLKKQVDFIQTDWVWELKGYLQSIPCGCPADSSGNGLPECGWRSPKER